MNSQNGGNSFRHTGVSVSDLREQNIRTILHCLIDRGSLSRADIASETGLGITALTKPIRQLQEQRIVSLEKPDQKPLKGRPTQLVTLASQPWKVLLLICDPLHIKISIGNLDGTVETSFKKSVSHTPGFDNYRPSLADAIAEAVTICLSQNCTIVGVEVAIAGAVNHQTGQVVRSVLNKWGTVDLRFEISAILLEAGVTTQLVNIDRETNYTVLQDVKSLGLLGTSSTIAYLGGRQVVTGAIFGKGEVDHGDTGLAGEFGHLAVGGSDLRCWCGRTGCLETRLGLASLYSACTGEDYDTSLERLYHDHKEMIAQIKSLITAQDRTAVEAFSVAARELVRTIDVVAGVINPSAFVIGGTLAQLATPLEDLTKEYLAPLAELPSIRRLDVHFAASPNGSLTRGLLESARRRIADHPAALLEITASYTNLRAPHAAEASGAEAG